MKRATAPLKDVISSDIVSIHPQESLREALTTMVENGVSALPVVDARGHCVGIISVTDLLGITKELSDDLIALVNAGRLDHEILVRKLEHTDLLTEPVQAWMSPDPISVGSHDSVQHAAQLMLRNHVHRLVVLDNDERLVGVVSTMDLLAAYAD